MRLSADPKHPDYCAAALPASVFLDGCFVQGCLSADEEAGTVVCVVTDARGWVPVNGNAVQEVTLHGAVDIVPHGEHFDSWMSRRTERAHREFMERTS